MIYEKNAFPAGTTDKLREAIKSGQVKNLKDIRNHHIANGGSAKTIDSYHNMLSLQGKLKKKYRDVIITQPKMFQEVVQSNIPKMDIDFKRLMNSRLSSNSNFRNSSK